MPTQPGRVHAQCGSGRAGLTSSYSLLLVLSGAPLPPSLVDRRERTRLTDLGAACCVPWCLHRRTRGRRGDP